MSLQTTNNPYLIGAFGIDQPPTENGRSTPLVGTIYLWKMLIVFHLLAYSYGQNFFWLLLHFHLVNIFTFDFSKNIVEERYNFIHKSKRNSFNYVTFSTMKGSHGFIEAIV